MMTMERMHEDCADQEDNSPQYTQMDDEQLLNKEEMHNQLLRMSSKMSSQKNLREFLGGI